MNVSHILATKGRAVVTIGRNQTVKEAVIELTEKDLGSLVVLGEHGEPVGIVSERDIIRQAANNDDVLRQRVAEVMTTDLITATPDADLHHLANTMTEHRVRHLPILAEEKLVGIVSIGDVVKAQRDLYRGEVDTLEIQIMSGKNPVPSPS